MNGSTKKASSNASSAAHRRRQTWIATAASLAVAAALFLAPPTALALPAAPTVGEASISEVTETSATFSATLNPHEKETTYAVQLITQAAFEADGKTFGAGTQTVAEGKITTGLAEPHTLGAAFNGLIPAGAYRARLHAKAGTKEAEAQLPFYTYAPPPPGLPDGRAYEQASPIGKDGGDVGGVQDFVKAASDGEGAIFGSSAGIPGGVGSQEFPFYAALRSPGGWLTEGLLPPAALAPKATLIGWAPDFSRFYQEASLPGPPRTAGLYERTSGGTETQIAPFLPGASYSYAGSSADGQSAVFESSAADLDPARPGAPGASNLYAYDGSGLHLASVLPGGAAAPKGAFAGPYDWVGGKTNKGGAGAEYYDQESRTVSADGSLFFTTAGEGHIYERRNPTAAEEGCADPAEACTLDVSASHRTPPDPAGHAPAAFLGASADGNTAFFASAEELTNDAHTGPAIEGPKIGRATIGSPPEEDPEETLTELLKDHHAVGLAVSDEHVFWADPLDGTIGEAKLNGSGTPTGVEEIAPGETCAETHPQTEPDEEQCEASTPRYVALGPCVEGGQCLYWTNTGPLGGDHFGDKGWEAEHRLALEAGTIGRARLDASEAIVPASVDPEFITGASNPQGIAVNSEHVYWANSLNLQGVLPEPKVSIARAALDGSAVEQSFHEVGNIDSLFGVALSATRVYWTEEGIGTHFGAVDSIPLEGGSTENLVVDRNPGAKPRGIAVIGPHLYWAAQGRGEIGRIRLPLQEPSDPGQICDENPRCQPAYLHVGGEPTGLAADPAGEHFYWSANGEVPPHPGNDLYRFQAQGTNGCDEAGGCLADLTADPVAENGAEVKGLLGVSEDGSRLYFAANGVLAHNSVENGAGPEEAEAGDCGNFAGLERGSCNLYAWEAGGGPAGSVSFLTRLDAEGRTDVSDQLDWAPKSGAGFGNLDEQKTSRVSADGKTLLFRSQRPLTAYDSHGAAELYLYRQGEGIACVSCNPTFAAPSFDEPGAAPGLGRAELAVLEPSTRPAAVLSRNLSASGGRVLFESTDPLSPADANGAFSCPAVGAQPGESGQLGYLSCVDVYEWEAPGEGSCEEGAPGYSPANQGCLFLISTGRGAGYPALLTDASASGSDVFFFDREGLVGQDADNLVDLYDARVGGGIAAQNPPPPSPPCEREACKPSATPPPSSASPATPSFRGPGNVAEKPCPKGRVRRNGRCLPSHHHHHHKHRRAHR